MTDQEIIYKAISEVVNTDKPAEFAAHNSTCYTIAKYMCEELRKQLKSIPAEQQYDSLDKFISSLLETYPTNKNEVPIEALNDYHQGLICGARKTYNWILESAIKIDAKIVNDEMSGCVVDCEQGCLVLEPHRYPIGQKLKILIIKEDEQ